MGLSMTPSAVRSRAKREQEREALGKQRRNWTPVADVARAIPRHLRERDARIQLKRRQRATFASVTRPHDAHVKAWRALPKPKPTKPHAAHVTAWRTARPGEAWSHRYRTDPAFNAAEKVRARLRKLDVLDGEVSAHMAEAVKAGAFRKTWQQLLGYDVHALVAHLRTTVPNGWQWEDFMDGGLHIDHIHPRSAFNLNDAESVRRCWALSNLQLLPALENLRKGARVQEAA